MKYAWSQEVKKDRYYITKENKFVDFPAFDNRPLDKIGSGDTFLTYFSSMHSVSKQDDLSLFVATIAASQNIKMFANEKPIDLESLQKQLKHILNEKKLDKRSIYLRSLILKLVAKERRGHIGSSMSIVEILRVLYDEILKHKNVKSINRDRFILSKGHGCLALYSILYDKKYLNSDHFKNFGTINSILGGHPEHFVPGVEFSTGSLGHGYPIAAGVAKALKLKKNSKIMSIVYLEMVS